MIKLMTMIISKDILYPYNKPFFWLLTSCKKYAVTSDKIPTTGSMLAINTCHFELNSDGANSDTGNRKSLHLPAIRRVV